jgi:quinol monooxygenase YgiN
MELYIFGRFRAREGQESSVGAAIADVVGPTGEEPGCLSVHAFRSIRDPRLFYIHSRWVNEEAFETHAALPHTVRFIERVEPLIDHAPDIARTEIVA